MNARIALCLLAATFCSTVLAHEPAASSTAGQPEMSAEDKAMMAAWEAASTPGQHHEYLAQTVGTWDVAVSSWMAPDQPVMTSTGTSENKMIFDGRYLEQRFTGSFMGMPFQGQGLTGYDNVKKEYVGSWIDSMSTTMLISTGKAKDGGKVMTFDGECSDPMTGKSAKYHQVLTITSPDRHTFEMWSKDPKSGKDFKAMELVYTRAGTASGN